MLLLLFLKAGCADCNLDESMCPDCGNLVDSELETPGLLGYEGNSQHLACEYEDRFTIHYYCFEKAEDAEAFYRFEKGESDEFLDLVDPVVRDHYRREMDSLQCPICGGGQCWCEGGYFIKGNLVGHIYAGIVERGVTKDDVFEKIDRILACVEGRSEPQDLTLNLPRSLDIYPTQPNSTVLELDHRGAELSEQVEFEVQGEMPPYLEISFEPQSTGPSNTGITSTKLNVTLKCSQDPDLKLPRQREIRIKASSGSHQATSQMTLNLRKAEWLVMLYLCADTKPDLQKYMLDNVQDMQRVSDATGTPKVGMTALIDLWKKDAIGSTSLPGNNAQFYQILNGSLVKVGPDWGPSNLSSDAILERFLEESTTGIPSKNTHLILSDHGAGIRGIDWDFHQGDRPMKFSPLKAALNDHQPDILSFDACLMAQVEILYHLRDVTDYFTCSELPVPGYGYAYQDFLTNLTRNPGMSALDYVKAIVSPFEARYDGSPGSLYRSNCTLSGIDSSKLGDVASAMDDLTKILHANYTAGRASFNRTISKTVYESWEAEGEPYTDIVDLAQNLLADPSLANKNLRKAALETITTTEKAVVANIEVWFNGTGHRQPSGFNGLATLIWRQGYDYAFSAGTRPSTIYNRYLHYYDQTEFAKDTAWRAFLEDFTNSLPANVTALTLLHPAHELYPHVYDTHGRHVGYNPSIADHNRNQIEIGIPNSFYIDYRNGTKAILLPPSVVDFEFVVDGTSMEEAKEPYTINTATIREAEIIDSTTIEAVIQEDTTHTRNITIEKGALNISENVVNWEMELPKWFENNLNFLLPILPPLLPYTPPIIRPYLGHLIIGVMVLFALIALVLIRKSMAGGDEKTEQDSLD